MEWNIVNCIKLVLLGYIYFFFFYWGKLEYKCNNNMELIREILIEIDRISLM